ncbi:unnamed protein product, partial [Polarella glacialis]
DIAALALKEFQAQQKNKSMSSSATPGLTSPEGVGAATHSGSTSLTREELLRGIAEENNARKAAAGPMDPAEFRRRQEQGQQGLRPPPGAAQVTTPLSYDKLLA